MLLINAKTQNLQASKLNQKVPVVWIDDSGDGRAVYALFRNEFELQKKPEKLTINLFADSRYALYVNGQFIQFGPVRFYPQRPMYDTYEIAPYLKTGKNVIAVKVLSNGMNTFQMPLSKGGFACWGKHLDKPGKELSFQTPGNWICKKSNGYDQSAPKMSFASGPIEIYDSRKEDQNWNCIEADISDWKKVVPLEDQNNWGIPQKRNIPYLTQDEVLPKSIKGLYKLQENNEILSFRVNSKDKTEDEYFSSTSVFAHTYIYSPKNQKVSIGGWWGDYWLNNEQIESRHDESNSTPAWADMVLELNKGWNFMFISYGLVWGVWDFHLSVPRSANLIFSGSKNKASEDWFRIAGPFTESDNEIIQNLKLPFSSPDDLPKLSKGWEKKNRGQSAGNPPGKWHGHH